MELPQTGRKTKNGPVAQLVAHLHGMQGVRGSSPLRSTTRESLRFGGGFRRSRARQVPGGGAHGIPPPPRNFGDPHNLSPKARDATDLARIADLTRSAECGGIPPPPHNLGDSHNLSPKARDATDLARIAEVTPCAGHAASRDDRLTGHAHDEGRLLSTEKAPLVDVSAGRDRLAGLRLVRVAHDQLVIEPVGSLVAESEDVDRERGGDDGRDVHDEHRHL